MGRKISCVHIDGSPELQQCMKIAGDQTHYCPCCGMYLYEKTMDQTQKPVEEIAKEIIHRQRTAFGTNLEQMISTALQAERSHQAELEHSLSTLTQERDVEIKRAREAEKFVELHTISGDAIHNCRMVLESVNEENRKLTHTLREAEAALKKVREGVFNSQISYDKNKPKEEQGVHFANSWFNLELVEETLLKIQQALK